MSYVPMSPPETYTPAYLYEELLRMQQALSDGPVLAEVFAEPNRVHGKLVFADGTQWNPGSGRGVYMWDEVVSAWRHLG